MTTSTDLQTLHDQIADRLAAAVTTRRGAWRTPVLSTIDADGAPNARTVVIRAIHPDTRSLEIFTDNRSAKIGEIAAEPRTSLTFWDPVDAEQLRLTGTCAAVADHNLVAQRWDSIGPRGHALYGEPGRQNFVVLKLQWTVWDWLWIGDIVHRRARFDWSTDGQYSARWIEP